MTTSITTTVQKTEVDQVGSVIVTDPVQDPDTSQYVREIRIFDGSNGSGNLIFTLRITAATVAAVQLTAPPQLF